MTKKQQKLPESINQTEKYAVIDKTGKIYEKTRGKATARHFLEIKKRIYPELNFSIKKLD
ncbi:MAG: hypothetical protein ACOC3Z_03410 [Nanoarchaeota archaeon]